MSADRDRRERLRRHYRPAQVRLLFIGESPPASGRFFYQRDSGLYRAMLEAFQLSDASVSASAFLDVFQRRGCYLVDLCLDPVDRMDAKSRRAACRAGEELLSKTIARLRPGTVACIVRSIESNVTAAAARARWNGTLLRLPYPGRWAHLKREFIQELAPVLAEIIHEAGPPQEQP